MASVTIRDDREKKGEHEVLEEVGGREPINFGKMSSLNSHIAYFLPVALPCPTRRGAK
jgi:hypothetical protein